MQIPTVEIEVNGRRKIVNADDPRAAGAKPEGGAEERIDIDAMTGPELTEALEAHGVEDIPHKIDDRRALLQRVVFVEV